MEVRSLNINHEVSKKINDLDWASNIFRMRKKIITRMIITIAGAGVGGENKLS